MTHDFLGRMARSSEESRAAGIDALIVTPSADLQYLVGYDAPLLERLTALIARSTARPVLVVLNYGAKDTASIPRTARLGSLRRATSFQDVLNDESVRTGGKDLEVPMPSFSARVLVGPR